MLGFAAFAFSFVTMFVFTSASRNRRENRPHSARLKMAGYFLCGLLLGGAAILALIAATGVAARL